MRRKSCLILFADVSPADERLLGSLKEEGFRYMDLSPHSIVRRCRCGRKSTLHVILSSDDEVENLKEGANIVSTLTEMCTERPPLSDRRPSVHLFSGSVAAEDFVDEMARIATTGNPDAEPSLIIRRVDRSQNVMYDALQTYPLFLSSPLETQGSLAHGGLADKERLYGEVERHLVLVGAGHIGYELLKGMLWCAHFDGTPTHIDVVDLEADRVRERLLGDAPGLEERAGGLANVRFHACDVQSSDYHRFLSENEGSITYLLFALGDDRLSAGTARRTREILEQTRFLRKGELRDSSPFIAVIVDDPALTSSIRRIQSPEQQPYHLMPLGDLDTTLSHTNVFRPQLEDMARRLNYAQLGLFEEDGLDSQESQRSADVTFDSYEHSRKSLTSSACFLKYDLHAFCCRIYQGSLGIDATLPSQTDWTKPLSDPAFDEILSAYAEYVGDEAHRLWLDELEHRRWVSCLHTEGFRAATEKAYEQFHPLTGLNQHPVARLHVCLVPFEDLGSTSAITQRIEGRPVDYERRSDRVIRNLPRIARG